MSKVIVKMDSKVLDDLVRKECIEYQNFIFKNIYNANEADLELGMWIAEDEYYDASTKKTMNVEEVYNLFKKSQSKEKVND